MTKIKGGMLIGAVLTLVMAVCSAPAYSQVGAPQIMNSAVGVPAAPAGAPIYNQAIVNQTMDAIVNTAVTNTVETPEQTVPAVSTSTDTCQNFTGKERTNCLVKLTNEAIKEQFLASHPCIQAMLEKPCKTLMIAERMVCIKQQIDACIAKRRAIMKVEHPCIASVVSRPCQGLQGMDKAVCIDQQLLACKNKWLKK